MTTLSRNTVRSASYPDCVFSLVSETEEELYSDEDDKRNNN